MMHINRAKLMKISPNQLWWEAESEEARGDRIGDAKDVKMGTKLIENEAAIIQVEVRPLRKLTWNVSQPLRELESKC